MVNVLHVHGRRSVALALSLAAIAAVIVTQFGGGAAPAAAKSSAQQELAALLRQGGGTAGPRARATSGASASTLSCGETLSVKATYTLEGSLICHGSDGIDITGSNIILNLNGFAISGGGLPITGGFAGVRIEGSSDTVENGFIGAFADGVFDRGSLPDSRQTAGSATGGGNTIKTITAEYNTVGIDVGGDAAGSLISDNVVFQNFGDGIDGSGASTYTGNHLLNNAGNGINTYQPGTPTVGNTLTGNVANGNAAEGIDSEMPDTLTGNTADFNDEYGIYASTPEKDGGKNLATGNTTHEQCYGVVCGPQS